MGRWVEKHGLAALALAVAGVCFGWTLWLGVPLIDVDEGRHAAIAQEMLERGDYVTPSLLGQGFFDKPVLFFWMQVAALRAWGMHEGAVRLPGLLCGLLGAVTTGLLGWRMFGPRAGWLALLFQTTLALPLALSQCAVHDVALVPWTNLALLALWEADRGTSARIRWGASFAAGLTLGIAILTKGLIGPALVLLTWSVFELLKRGQEPAARGQRNKNEGRGTSRGNRLLAPSPGPLAPLFISLFRLVGVLAVALLVASPWYVLMSLQNPGYAYYYLFERHVLGYVSDTQRHGERPVWYYLPILLGGGLPWIAYLPAQVQDGWLRWRSGALANPTRVGSASFRNWPRWAWMTGMGWIGQFRKVAAPTPASQPTATTNRGSEGHSAFDIRPPANRTPSLAGASGLCPGIAHERSGAARLLAGVWLVASTLFLTIAHSKMPTYILPAFPAIALLAADVWERRLRSVAQGASATSLRPPLAWSKDDELLPAAQQTFDRAFWLTAAAAPLLVPAAFGVAQWGFALQVTAAAWLGAVLTAVIGIFPLHCWRQQRPTASLGSALALLAMQFGLVATVLLPQAAAENSAKLLAGELNRHNRPLRVWFLEERIGSIIFYLRPELRTGLASENLRRVNVTEFREGVQTHPGFLIVLPEREVDDVGEVVPLQGVPYRTLGRYRLYDSDAFIAPAVADAARVGSDAGSLSDAAAVSDLQTASASSSGDAESQTSPRR